MFYWNSFDFKLTRKIEATAIRALEIMVIKAKELKHLFIIIILDDHWVGNQK